jgi:hypothetical protein
MFNYLRFEEQPNPGRKTKCWTIVGITAGVVLGDVYFHVPWRKYVWRMGPGCIFDVGCTQEIIDFLTMHKDDRNA